MPEAVRAVLEIDGLVWLALATCVAGIVRGFSGFGTAMIFVPIAGRFIEPFWILAALAIMDFFGPLPNLPRAWRDGEPRDVGRLALATLLALPLGLAFILAVPAEVFRYLVSALAILVPVLLLAGLRYRGEMTPRLLYGTGAVAGITGGAAGLPGPPVIMLYAASTSTVSSIRANTMMYLFAFDVMLLAWLAVQGRLEFVPVMLGLVLFPIAVIGNIIGAAIFDPAREKLYRAIAYAVIFTAAITSLPIWDG